MPVQFTEPHLRQLLTAEQLEGDLLKLLQDSPEHRAEAMRILWALRLAASCPAATPPAKSRSSDPADPWSPSNGGWQLKERLWAYLGHAGRLHVRGLASFRALPLDYAATSLDAPAPPSACSASGPPSDPQHPSPQQQWRIPIPQLNCWLCLAIRPAPTPHNWELRCGIQSQEEPLIAQSTRITLQQEGHEPELVGPLKQFTDGPLYIGSGQWRLTIRVGDDLRIVPIQVGAAPAGSDR